MYLKTLSVVGFKSFADRTRLEFEPGVNVIVGPNGSGKSNLLDALAWVMGSRATRMLRTQQMDDVIFAGTATRPALGRAEVKLTFDNAEGMLDVDLPEVRFTRRLYRDGTSEYELNGTSCRLLDLQELLSDSGVGRHQHVLVGQGQIGDILNSRPDEHRTVIEEAAGITKHRSRRDRSVRRLEQTAVDVTRLEDILDQQRRRMRPLKRQAKAAERYDSVRAQARALRLWLGGKELTRLVTRLGEAEREKAELSAAVQYDERALAEIVASLGGLRSAAGEVGRSLERDTAAAARLETTAERLNRIGLVSRERRLALESRMAGADDRRRDLAAEQEDLAEQIEETRRAEAAARSLVERTETALLALEDEERALAEQIQLPAESLVATLRGDLRALETAAERDRREAEGIRKRREVVVARLEEEAAEQSRITADIQTIDIEVADAQDEYHQSSEGRERAQAAWEQADAVAREAGLDHAKAAARVEAIRHALDGLGDPEARRRAAEAQEVVGTLVSSLDVPEDVAAAVDAALGWWSDAYVTSGSHGLTDLVATLKSEGYGGVRLVSEGSDAPGDAPAHAVAESWGVEALIDRLGGDANRHLAHALVGDVVLIEGWSSAWSVVQRSPHIRAVTPEGDLVTAHGIVLAEADGAGPAALEAAVVMLEQADRELARAASRQLSTRRDFEASRQEERERLERLEALETRLAGTAEAMALLGRARAEGAAEIERLDDRLRGLQEAATVRDERIAELRARVAEFEGEEAARQEAWEALNRRREDVARRTDQARREHQTAAGQLAAAAERAKVLESRLGTTATELAGLDVAPVDPHEIARLADIEERARRAVHHVRSHVTSLRGRQRELRERSGAADERLEVAYEEQRDVDERLTAGRTKLSALAIELAELRVRREAVAEALRRDVDADEDQAMQAPMPELEDDVDPDERLTALEADLRRMGAVNPLAAAEYRELEEQVLLLESQLADLEESRRDLRKVIATLDEEMANLFVAAFDEISELFAENFGLVFPGGIGRLRLTEPDQPLTSGVEIEAQPHGKKVGRLSLLSGGERALAALAFLFAVFRARPSPFYVLDEVEAALDDSNLRRFLRLVDTLRTSAQLVIITHQQQTMEAADILYGVTMEPGESSKVVSKRLAPARA